MDGNLLKQGNVILDCHPSSEILLNADLSAGHGLRACSNAETYIKLHKNAKLIVNGHFKMFFGSSIEVFSDGVLTLNGGYINVGTTIACACGITIGSNANIARNVFKYDSDHHHITDSKGNTKANSAVISIGNKVWIGTGAIILKGVSIGDGAVIGAGAVVTSNVPAGCTAAGNPAKVIQ
jgi:acetyltransferase-like isoleucine patch superfamily enzyme